MIPLLDILISALATIGLLASSYLLLGGRGDRAIAKRVGLFLPWKWRQTGRVQEALEVHPATKLFGVRNEVFALVFYSSALLSVLSQNWLLFWIARCGAFLVLLISSYLLFALNRRLKRRCALCFMLNIINGFLAAALWNMPIPV